MNKSEKIICLILGAILAWYIWGEMGRAKERAAAAAEQAAIAATNQVEVVDSERRDKSVASPLSETAGAVASESGNSSGDATLLSRQEGKPTSAASALPSVPEELVTLENDEVKLTLSTWGAVVKAVTLKAYATDCGDISETNPAVAFDFGAAAIGAAEKVEAFAVTAKSENSVSFACGDKTRTITLKPGYQIELADNGIGGTMAIGAMTMGASKNDLLSVDSWSLAANKGKGGVIHHGDDDSPLKPYLVGGLTGGCSGSKDATGMAATSTVAYPGAQTYVALKNRFFVTALVSSTAANTGFSAEVVRDVNASAYRPLNIAARMAFADAPTVRTSVFYVGPKKQSLLWDLGMKDVMEFGMWRWLCYPLVAILNFFHGWIPNFGIAIILLTILVRLVFWPLTHKSTVGMKKMQEIQPLMKEIQAKYKDNPQRLQQETWALYRDKKVNPMSSCLPMLIQIPIFIALFNVLRSAVELRYAPFLWIADLSEPEALFASWFPFGGLNILPILMAATTALQSSFTPSTGDNQQQKMMMVFMPIMMLVMFYSFPSALSLYWFLSNLFSIVQMYLIRRQTAAKKEYAMPDQIIDPPQTRQQRRHS